MPVTMEQAAELIDAKQAGCHDFEVNPACRGVGLGRLEGMISDFNFKPTDGDAYLMQRVLLEAMAAAKSGAYGVAAALATVRNGAVSILYTQQNERRPDCRKRLGAHAEERLIEDHPEANPYFENGMLDHSKDIVGVNLSPCPGCMKSLVEACVPKVRVGSPDPRNGVALLQGDQLEIGVGQAKKGVIDRLGLQYTLPEIGDRQTRNLVMGLCWAVFHENRGVTHFSNYHVQLDE